MEDYKEKWNRCLDKIRANIGEERFRVWFSKVEAREFKDNRLVLLVPSRFYMEKFEDDFYPLLMKAIRSEFGSAVALSYDYYVIAGDTKSKVAIQSPEQSHLLKNKFEQKFNSRPIADQTEEFDPQLNSSLNFENYCVGHSNILPYTIAKHIADFPEKHDFNPFFLYGNVGVGKTHLIQAIGIRIKERNPRARVVFTTIRQFQNLYQNAYFNKRIPQFINWFQEKDAILFDDLQELTLGNKAGTMDALFAIFNHLHQHNKKLIFTCDRPVMELDGITDRLIDRFKWGATEKLENPDLELRRKILKFKAERNGLDLSDDIIELIASSSSSSIRELEGIVMGLYTRSISENAPITLRLAERVISHFVKKVEKKSINFDMIVENTAEFYKLSPDVIFSKSRVRDIADARHVIMYLCSKHTNLSSPAIGAKLNRKHATVLHGINAVKDRLEISPELNDQVVAIEKMLFG